jgi:hypothetical protein
MTGCCGGSGGRPPTTNNKFNIEDEAQELERQVDKFIKLESTVPRKKKEDSLELIFQKQKELLDHLNEQKPDNYYNGPERYPFEKVMHMMTAMSDEFSEVRAGIKWKHWKTYDDDSIEGGEDDSAPDFDTNKISNLPQNFLDLPDLEATQKQILKDSNLVYLRKEWVDILHFWIQGAQELGMDAKMVLDMYLDKNTENSKRYDEGY